MYKNVVQSEHFVCRGQCAAGACLLKNCLHTGMPRRPNTAPQAAVRVSAADASGAEDLGVALDIGTTTLELLVADLRSKKTLVSGSVPNMQAQAGADVISRIDFAGSVPDGTAEMHGMVRGQFGTLLRDCLAAAGLDEQNLVSCVVTGNTTMLHLAAGRSPASMGVFPYTPQSLFGVDMPPETLGLDDRCHVYFAPCVSAFVGADVVCALLDALQEHERRAGVLVDLGTNGEIIAWAGDTIVATASAAGPVFEGGGIACGMPAIPGAVRRVVVNENNEVQLETIAGEAPAGMCGSGVVDAVAAALALGAVDGTGALQPGAPRTSQEENGKFFALAENVYLTQKDVRAFQSAKAAIFSGVQIVLGELGVPQDQPPLLYLAGGLGTAVNIDSAFQTGIVPRGNGAVALGNAALRGARRLLLSPGLRPVAEQLARRTRALDLGTSPAFNAKYIENMVFTEEIAK